MVDYNMELGKSLEKILRKFNSWDYLYVQEIIEKLELPLETVQDRLYALYELGYVRAKREIPNNRSIDLADEFCLSAKGINYIELHQRFWQLFWVQSILCPVAVSLITALNADRIVKFIYYMMSMLLPLMTQ